jgi:hypothetical protein
LLSNAFLASRYCNDVEWPLFQARHRDGACELAPVLIRQCYFEKSHYGAYQLIRPNGRAVEDHPTHAPAWRNVLDALNVVIARALAKRSVG